MPTTLAKPCRLPPLTLSALSAAIAIGISVNIAPTHAQTAAEATHRGSVQTMLEEITVTGRKRAENVQDVPLSITALGTEQIDALKIRDLTNLAVAMPNVAMDDVGTSRGIANFSIRGLGINSSIPSIDPTVGVFVDGVYLAVNTGTIFDTFDLEGIEVLRGPQGTLFGRNVTGGAVLIKTKRPGDELEVKVRSAVEGGGEALNTYAMSSVSGPITDNLGGKLVLYYNNDDGWFENLADGEEFGENRTKMARGMLDWDVNDGLNIITRYEYSEANGDGPAAQSHTNGSGTPNANGNFDRDSFNFAVDEPGFNNNRTDFLTLEANQDVELGNGTVTAIFGWRDGVQTFLSDIDASTAFLSHTTAWLDSEQYSYELRYNGQFDALNLTAGLYHFTNDVDYHERRALMHSLFGYAQLDGGGLYAVETSGIFIAADYALTDKLTLNSGIRYTDETKDVKIASLPLNQSIPLFAVNSECNIVTEGDCPFDFNDDQRFRTWSPKLGLTYSLTEDTLTYGHWARGYRSGGYNLRNSAAVLRPEAFGDEKVDTFEVGIKQALGDRGHINAALFYSKIADMQRELNLQDPAVGVVQFVRNTADATIAGIEVDATYALTDTLLLTASVGYLDANYDKVSEDLNSDGVVNSGDEDLELPRAAEWTYSVGLSHDLELGEWGYITSRVSYAYRDDSAYTDNNLGYIDQQQIVDAGIDFYSRDGHWNIGLYGRNLLDEVKHGGDSQLPPTLLGNNLGGTFSPLAKGRVYGLDVTYTF